MRDLAADHLCEIADRLAACAGALRFPAPVTHVYNPLRYARAPHQDYLGRYGQGHREILLLGMNPGPWGMAQTGVPFGDVVSVRDWLRIQGRVERPAAEHPKRPVRGFDCPRREVSGQRLWGWARERFGTPETFFSRFFVHNYCPLCFMTETGRNFTPDKLAAADRKELDACCDTALRSIVAALKPATLIGVGAYAEKRLRVVFSDFDGVIGRLPHPSPASPAANRGWAAAAEAALRELGIALPEKR